MSADEQSKMPLLPTSNYSKLSSLPPHHKNSMEKKGLSRRDNFDNDNDDNFENSMTKKNLLFVFLGSLLVVYVGYKLISILSSQSHIHRSSSSSSSSPATRPTSIVFFLVDDLGHNDMGYNSFDIAAASPYMTAAAEEGIIISNYYTYSQCTPTRSSLLTGMYSSSIGMQHDCITSCDPFGVPSSFKLLPTYLQEQRNYVTAMIGKWDIGHYYESLWPTERGFDNSLHLVCYGYLDYSQHIGSGGFFDLHDGFVKIESGENIRGVGQLSDEYSSFLFMQRSLAIVQEHSDRLKGTFGLSNDDYDSILDANKYLTANEGGRNHGTTDPGLFLYVAWNAVHTTLSVPKGYNLTKEYATITEFVDKDDNPDRALLAGALKVIDLGFKLIVDKLKTESLFEETIILVVSDNGGSVDDGGNNYPLRGGKKTNFEGGIHVPAFIFGAMVPNKLQGSVYSGLFHVSDWLPTLAYGLQGLTVPDHSFDGVDHWSIIIDEVDKVARTQLTCALDYLTESHDNGGVTEAATSISDATGCLLMLIDITTMNLIDDDDEDAGDDVFFDIRESSTSSSSSIDNTVVLYKFIWNQEFINWIYPSYSIDNFLNASAFPASRPRGGAYLFDLNTDPYEKTNLLWLLDGTSDPDQAVIESIVLNFAVKFCYEYGSTMVAALWKQKQSYAKSVFAANNDFITHWIEEEILESDFASDDGSPSGAECDSDDILNRILQDN